MPTKNLVIDFGGVGDGQRATKQATITSGTGALSVAVGTGTFVTGDINKAISIWFGNSYYFGTITARSSADAITISPNITFGLAGNSVDILWGTDNTNAFTGVSGWRAYAQTQTNPSDIPILEIPDGNYAFRSSSAAGAAMHYGVLNSVKVTGLSGTATNCKLMQLANNEMRFGTDVGVVANRGLTDSGGNSARLTTASVGVTKVILVDPTTYGARIVVDRVCLLAAYDMQGLNESFFGYPPNSFFFEWNVITAYNSGTGEVTLQNPLTQTYKSTYPRWGDESTIFGADQGGPFTIWVMGDGYNNTVTLENMTIDSTHNQCAIHMRYWIGNNLIMNGPGLYPTQNDVVELNECVYPQQLEIDKMTNQVTWNNCTLRKLQQQSASPNKMYINGGTLDILETAKFTQCTNVAFTNEGQISVGVSAYGRTNRVVLDNCTGIKIFQRGGATTDDLGGSSGTNSKQNASDFFTFDSGVIKFLKTLNDGHGGTANNGQQNPTRLFVPGTWLFFDDKYIDQIDDVYEDGTYCYVRFVNTTDWPFTPVARLSVHPCPDFTMINCTGTASQLEDWNQATNRIPLYSYSKRAIVGGPTSATGLSQTTSPILLGRLVSEKINVTVPYVGAGTLTFKDSQFLNRTYVKRSDWTTSATYGNTINMKIGGVQRVINAATTATGAQTSDVLMNMTTPGEVNFKGAPASGIVFSANVTNGETPTVTVEYIMDHGIPVAVQTAASRLRLRLHG